MSPESWPDVLLVEDEDAYVEALSVGLAQEKFHVRVARAGAEALAMFDENQPDLVLLDIMLPDMSGIDVCRSLRRRSDVPILVVSAKNSEVDTVVGLEIGADDYITKPFRLRELVARMRAALRRAPRDGDAAVPQQLVSEDLKLDRDRREVTFRGQGLRLPLKEFELLELLMASAGKVVTRKTIIDRVWGASYVGDTKTLDVHVKRLRTRLEDDRTSPRRIVTIRGVGYRFEPEAN
jgi:two-component system response regulator RegX3